MEKWIRMRGLRLSVAIGIHEFEKVAPQSYVLDIDLRLPDDFSTYHDAISETVNYDALRERVKLHLASKHFNLQETLMQDVVSICFGLDERVIAVSVVVGKTTVYDDCDFVGLHYAVARSEWGL